MSSLLCCPLLFTRKKERKEFSSSPSAWCFTKREAVFLDAIVRGDTEKITRFCQSYQVTDEDDRRDTLTFGLRLVITSNNQDAVFQVSLLLNRMRKAPPLDLFRFYCSEHVSPPEIFGLLIKKWILHLDDDNDQIRHFARFLQTLLLENRVVFGVRQLHLLRQVGDCIKVWRNALSAAIGNSRGVLRVSYRLLTALTPQTELQRCLDNAVFVGNSNAIRTLSYCPFLRVPYGRVMDKSTATIFYRTMLYRKRGLQRFIEYTHRFLERFYSPSGGAGYQKVKSLFYSRLLHVDDEMKSLS